MDEPFPSSQQKEQDKCVDDDTDFVYTGERIWVWRKERRERGCGQGRGRANTSLITSFLAIVFSGFFFLSFFFFKKCHCKNNTTQKRKCKTRAQLLFKFQE